MTMGPNFRTAHQIYLSLIHQYLLIVCNLDGVYDFVFAHQLLIVSCCSKLSRISLISHFPDFLYFPYFPHFLYFPYFLYFCFLFLSFFIMVAVTMTWQFFSLIILRQWSCSCSLWQHTQNTRWRYVIFFCDICKMFLIWVCLLSIVSLLSLLSIPFPTFLTFHTF